LGVRIKVYVCYLNPVYTNEPFPSFILIKTNINNFIIIKILYYLNTFLIY
jgi:hypothetical protein